MQIDEGFGGTEDRESIILSPRAFDRWKSCAVMGEASPQEHSRFYTC